MSSGTTLGLNDDLQGLKLCNLAKQSPAKFWRIFKTKKQEIQIQDKAVWEQHLKICCRKDAQMLKPETFVKRLFKPL